MPSVTFTFTAEQATRTLAAEKGFDPIPAGAVNPATGQPWTDFDWWKRCVIAHLKRNVFLWERKTAIAAATAAINPDPDIGG